MAPVAESAPREIADAGCSVISAGRGAVESTGATVSGVAVEGSPVISGGRLEPSISGGSDAVGAGGRGSVFASGARYAEWSCSAGANPSALSGTIGETL